MKKLTAWVLMLTMLLSLTACGKKQPEETNPTPSPEVTVAPETDKEEETQKPAGQPDETPAPTQKPCELPAAKPTEAPKPVETPKPAVTETPSVIPALSEEKLQTLLSSILAGTDEIDGDYYAIPKDEDSYQYNLYTSYQEGYESMSFSPMIGSLAYFVALVSVPSDVDANAMAAAMQSGINPHKWVCVEADQYGTLVNGNVILLYMIDSETFPDTVETLKNNFRNATV